MKTLQKNPRLHIPDAYCAYVPTSCIKAAFMDADDFMKMVHHDEGSFFSKLQY